MIFNASQLRFHIGTEAGASEGFTYEDLVVAARHVAWQYSIGKPGQMHPPGDMLRSVLHAMATADPGNLARLRRAFPLHAALVRGIKNDDPATRHMILNLLDYHLTEGWTNPDLLRGLPALPGPDNHPHTDDCDHVTSAGVWDCSCHESETP